MRIDQITEDAEPMDREFALVKKLGRLGERVAQNPRLWEKYTEAVDSNNLDWIVSLIQEGTGADKTEVMHLSDLFGEIGGGLGRLVDFAWAVKEGTWAEDFMNPYRQHRRQGTAGQLNELFDDQQEYFKLADGQVIRVDYKQAGLNPDGMPGSIKIIPVDPKIMPMSGMQVIQPWDKARQNIRMAIQKWVQSGQQDVAESTGNIGRQIKAVYKKIYDAGDDAVEFAYYDSPIFAQYWDEYEGDLDSIIAEVEPSELQIILDELTAAAANQEDDEDDYYSLPMPNGDRDEFDEGGENWIKLPNGNYRNTHTGVVASKSPVKKKRGEKTGAEWDAIKAKKEQGVAEGKPEQPEADYGDDYQAMVARVKKLAGLGPLKTVYDPQKRVYKNVPVAVQPAQQPKK